jgi:tRNA threonylcarbamoyladenosine biosynthesis protein TsaE
MTEYISDSVASLDKIARNIIDRSHHKVFALYGEMGSGKTTLIKALCARLNVTDIVTSPTFAIMNEYHRKDGEPVYHFDFYRIKNISEAYDLGYENFLFSGNYCFIEWPEKIESLLDFPKAAIFIASENNHRIITLN